MFSPNVYESTKLIESSFIVGLREHQITGIIIFIKQ